MKLYGYFRSSAAFRVRIGLNLKGLAYDQESVHLRKGEQRAPEFLRRNPQGLVPALEDGPALLTQSLAILEYLDEIRPQPPFLPKTPVERARVRALALSIACEIHPLNNLRVLTYLEREMKQPKEARDTWYRHWVIEGFKAFEAMLADGPAGRYCHGEQPTQADICLVPQVFNAQRLDTPLAAFPRLMRAFEACMKLPEFERAQPSQQPDRE